MSILFIYARENKIKAIDIADTERTPHSELIAQGWRHTATIDPITTIENAFRNGELQELSKIN